jgi:hypothetical protein
MIFVFFFYANTTSSFATGSIGFGIAALCVLGVGGYFNEWEVSWMGIVAVQVITMILLLIFLCILRHSVKKEGGGGGGGGVEME